MRQRPQPRFYRSGGGVYLLDRRIRMSGAAAAMLIGGAFGPKPGDTIIDTATTGAGQTITLPAGNRYHHVDVYIAPRGGAGSATGGKGGSVDYGGGGGSSCIFAGLSVSPGTTILTYTLPSVSNSPATLTGTGISLSAPGGIDGTSTVNGWGLAPAIATGGTTNWQGHRGGLTNTWDGGGCFDPTGTVVDNTSDGTPGVLAGQGGSGTFLSTQVGGPPRLLIIARA